jgi:hypothetical protein
MRDIEALIINIKSTYYTAVYKEVTNLKTPTSFLRATIPTSI